MALVLAQVERDATLVATHALPHQPDAILAEAPGTHWIAAVRLFDLDDLGAMLAQSGRDHRPGGERRRVDDADPMERTVGLSHG